MTPPIVCDLCSRSIAPHAHYVVRMDVFADPTLPPLHFEQLNQSDHAQTLQQVIQEVEHLSAEDLQDQVHRRFEYNLCPSCHRLFLSNPLGKPRRRPIGIN